MQHDPWVSNMLRVLSTLPAVDSVGSFKRYPGITVTAALKALGVPYSVTAAKRMARCLRSIGWAQKVEKRDGRCQRVYRPWAQVRSDEIQYLRNVDARIAREAGPS